MGAFPFGRTGRDARAAFLALAVCGLLTACALELAFVVDARNRAAGQFLPIPAHPKGWRYELPWTLEPTSAGLVEVPNPDGLLRNALHDSVRAFAPWLALLPILWLWTLALLGHPRTPRLARAGALAILSTLVGVQRIVGPLDLSAALSGD